MKCVRTALSDLAFTRAVKYKADHFARNFKKYIKVIN